MKMAEHEQQFRHDDQIEVRVIQRKLLTRGQIFGFGLSVLIVVGGIFLIAINKPTEGFIAILGSASTILAHFLYRVRRDKKERDATV